MKFHLGHLLGLSAIVLAIAAAFFSVTGLGQLFAGASIAVMIMAASLEFSKVIIATFLHKYWGEISKLLKIYLTIGLIVLVGITSAGIYGFLSSAYQQTATELEGHDSALGLIDNKIVLVNNKINSNDDIIKSKMERYGKLMNLREKQENRLDSMISRRYFSNANQTRDEIEKANTQMVGLQSDIDEMTILNNKLNDSIAKFELNKLEMKSNSKVAGEVGPLKYLAELTGQPMDTIVNYFTLLLIFVFDPLAISLIMATNWVFERRRLDKTKEPLKPKNSGDMGPLEKEIRKPHRKVSEYKFNNKVIDKDEVEDTYKEESPTDINNIEVIDEEEVLVPDVKDIKQDKLGAVYSVKGVDRGFSTKIPEPLNNERRLGTNKVLKNNKTVIYKNKGEDGNK